MSTNGSHRHLADIVFLCLWGILAVLTITLPGVRDSIARALLAGSFVLFAPGYALVAAVFVRKEQLTLLERVVFSVGSSLALIGLGGLVLTEIPALGVRLETVVIAQLILTGALLAIALYRRHGLDPSERAAPADEIVSLSQRAWAGRSAVGGGSTAIQIAIVLAVVASLGATVFVAATPLPSEKYTEFYVLGPDGDADGIPETIDADEDIEVLVGVANHEHRPVGYDLQIQTRGAEPRVVAIEHWQLDHGASREELFVVDPTAEETVVLDFLLFYEGQAAPNEVVDPATADRHLTIRVTVES